MLIWLLPALLLYTTSAQASHSMGADLTYTWMGGNTYKVTLTFYRDCNGIAAPSNPAVTISSATLATSFTVTGYPLPGTCKDVTPVCSTAVTTCFGGVYTGIQECKYEGTITLPGQAPDWIFSYSLCCRNAAITTISYPSTNTFYIYASLNNTVAQGNNSPTFSNKPVPFVCKGQQYCFNHGAFDADGDSLVYELINPLQTATTQVVYNSPYTSSQPLNSSPAVTLNPLNGDICMTPQSMEVTVMAVLVKEYRNGVLIGTVERDMQITVMNCSNTLPSLSGINGTTNFSTIACANSPLCFDLQSSDADAGQNLTIAWNNAISGATFTSSGSSRPKGTFCWTPHDSDIGNTYTFTVKVTDNACPFFGSQIFSYTIFVSGFSLNAGPDQQINCNSNAVLTAVASGGTGPYTYSWSNGATTPSITVGGGTYIVMVTNGGCQAYDTVKVTGGGSPPTPVFSVNNNCIGATTCFTNQTATSSNWLWNFGDGSTSIQKDPCHTYAAAGTYTVTLTSGDTACPASVTKTVSVYPLPVANAGADKAICSGSSTVLSASPANSYSWSPSGSTTQSITVSPVANTNYILTITDNNGCSSKDTVAVTVNPNPVVTLASGFVCKGSSITLDAGNAGAAYAWSTGATTQSISVNDSGNYSVVVTNSYGCSSSATTHINAGASLNSVSSTASICPGASTVLNAGNPGCTYSWSNGSTTQQITVNNTGNYSVVVTDALGCSITFTQTVTPAITPVAQFTANSVCTGIDMVFSNTSTNVQNASWDFGDGNSSAQANATHRYSSPGNYIVSLTVTSSAGCTSAVSKTVTVNPNPVASFMATDACLNQPNTFISNATIASGSISSLIWDFGDGSTGNASTVNHIYNYAGKYIVKLVAVTSYGCSDTATNFVNVNDLPHTDFSVADACLNAPLVITNKSATGNIAYKWVFEGGFNSTAYQPAYAFNTPGLKNIQLSATSSAGCTDSVMRQVRVFSPPTASITTSDNCLKNATTVKNNSVANEGFITSLKWEFGDGTAPLFINGSFTIADTAHLYAAIGQYDVSLTVMTNNGCSDSTSRPVRIFPLPEPLISTKDVCPNDTVKLSDKGIYLNPVLYQWDLGDGNTSTQPTLNHVYANSGNYTISLTITDQNGCSATDSSRVKVYALPQVSFSSNNSCFGSPSVFNNTSPGNNSYTWNFGDGSTSVAQNPSYIYKTPGNYNVTLTGISSIGCSATITQQVNIKPLPVPAFNGGGGGCASFTATFNDISYDNNATITGWTWDFGDGSTSNQQNPVHDFKQSGNFNVSLTVTSSDGCTATTVHNNAVMTYPSPSADFKADIRGSESFTKTVRFNNLSNDFMFAYWNFGDGISAINELNPSHQYEEYGKYEVRLVVVNSYGCMDTVTNIVELKGFSTLYVPTAFTPNNDGSNDDFRPYFTQIRDMEVLIFDRWGSLVTSWSGLNGSWDGTYKGQPVQQGIYVYRVTATGEDNKYYDLTGQVAVVR